MYIVRTHGWGEGGLVIEVNLFNVQGGRGSKNPKKVRAYYVHAP